MSETDPVLKRRGLMLVLSSPSGAGKTTISRRLLEQEPDLTLSVSVTTRPQRPGEVDGRDYHFISQAEFDQLVADDGLLEHATVFGNSYGTPLAPVEAAMKAGRDVLFDVDWQGAQQMRTRRANDIVGIFILPPSTRELERRLRTRASDSDEVIRNRMAGAASEMSHYDGYDYAVVNQDVDASLAQVTAILNAERARQDRLPGLADFVRTLTGG